MNRVKEMLTKKNLTKIVLILTILCSIGGYQNKHYFRIYLGDQYAQYLNLLIIALCLYLLYSN